MIKHPQAGYMFGMVIAIVTLMALLAAGIAASLQSSRSASDRSKLQSQAVVILNQGAAIDNAFQQLLQANYPDYRLALHDSRSAAVGACTNGTIFCMFEPGSGVMSRPKPPVDVFATINAAEFHWTMIWSRNATAGSMPPTAEVRVTNFGTDLGCETVIFLPNLKREVCQSINMILFNLTDLPDLPTLVLPLDVILTGSSTSLSLITTTLPPAYPVRVRYPELCYEVMVNDNPIYTYMRVVAER